MIHALEFLQPIDIIKGNRSRDGMLLYACRGIERRAIFQDDAEQSFRMMPRDDFVNRLGKILKETSTQFYA
jgi:hypothetical protein